MKKAHFRLKDMEFTRLLKEAQKDPQFIKDINKFIKATTS